MSGWDVTVSLISGLQLQLDLHAQDRYSKIIAQVRRRWGIPDRCQKLVWNGDILRKDELCDLGPYGPVTVSLITDFRVETLLGTNKLTDWQEAADLVACWACRDCEGARPLLHTLQDHFIALTLDRRPDSELVATTVIITATRREADALLVNRHTKPYVAFSCEDGTDGAMLQVAFHTRAQLRYRPGHTTTILRPSEAQLGFRMLQPAAEVLRAMTEIQTRKAVIKDVLEDMGDRDLASDLFYAVVLILQAHQPTWTEWIWGVMRRRLSRLELGHETRVLKLFFEGQHARQEDLVLAEARLSMFPTEPRGVAAKIIRMHGRAGHARTVRALVDCIDELQAEVAPTIPRTLGLIAHPGDSHAIRSLRGCIHAVRQAVPKAGLGERAQQHWQDVQTSLMKQLIVAMGRLGEVAGPGPNRMHVDQDWDDEDATWPSALPLGATVEQEPSPASPPNPFAAERARRRINNRRLG